MADDFCSKSNFASFRNVRLRIKIHEPRYIQGEEMLRWGWLLCIILVVVWGARLPSVENEGEREAVMVWYFRVIS